MTSLTRSIENWVSTGATGIEYTYAVLMSLLSLLAYGVRLIWGEEKAKDIFK
jgi:hypothetical protein